MLTAKHVETLDRLAAHLEAIDVWTRVDRASRKPRFSRDDIDAAATRIADTEGFEAVSMRRLAAELDAGTMTLYHCVRTKDELLTLVVDAFLGEVVLPPEQRLPRDWRVAITLIGRRTRDALRRHPWVLDITDDPSIGPNAMRMKTTRPTRPTVAPAYYLGRPAATWQAVVPRRGPRAQSEDLRATRDTTLAFFVRGGSRWN